MEKTKSNNLFGGKETTVLFPDWLADDSLATIEKSMGEVTSKCIVITEERKEHIKEKHQQDYDFVENNLKEALLNPDLILEDNSNEDTILVIKHVSESGLNVVVRLQIAPNDLKYENSVITAYRVGEVSVCRLIKKNTTLIDFTN